jgi:hypothetical protein
VPREVRIATDDPEPLPCQKVGQVLDRDRLVVPGGVRRGLRRSNRFFTRHKPDQRRLLFQQPRQQRRWQQPTMGIHPQGPIPGRCQDRPRFLQLLQQFFWIQISPPR